jgi:hypothetical protein
MLTHAEGIVQKYKPQQSCYRPAAGTDAEGVVKEYTPQQSCNRAATELQKILTQKA